MYTLTENQLNVVEDFVNSIEPSTIGGKYETWLVKIKSQNGRITTHDMDEFTSLANGLNTDSQHLPQEILYAVKNGLDNEGEAAIEVKKAPIKDKVPPVKETKPKSSLKSKVILKIKEVKKKVTSKK